MRPPLTVRSLASRRNSVFLGAACVATAALVGWMAYANEYIGQVWNGPAPAKLADVGTQGEKVHGRWLEVTSDVRAQHLLKTTTTTTRRRGGTSTSITNHYALFGPKGVQIVESGNDSLPSTFLAWASDFNTEGDYYKRARSQLDTWTRGQGSAPISPVLLTTSGSVKSSQNFLFGALSLAGLILLTWFGLAARTLMNYLKTPAIARLKKSVRAPEGVATLVGEIDQHLAQLDPAQKRTGILFTPRWIVNAGRNSFSLISAEDIVFVAPYTVGKNHVIRVASRTGDAVELQVSEDRVVPMLDDLFRWAPWATVGNEPEMERRFGKLKGRGGFKGWFRTWPSKKTLIARVDERRAYVAKARAEYAQSQGRQG